MKRILLLLLLMLAALPVSTKKQSIGPSKLKKPVAVVELYDTLTPREGDIVCSGYDKPNRANRETFFVTNNTTDTVSELNLTFTYFDLQGRQLHSATHSVTVLLPPGETRNVSVRSWDSNNSFHYELSPAPKRRASTPYRVRSRINFLLKK